MTDTTQDTRCRGKNRAGDACRNPVILASGFCIVHDPESELHAKFMPGEGHTISPGGPRKLSENEVIRQMVEERLPEIVGVYFDALKAEEHGTRIAGADRLLDRALGKPKQAVDVDHTSGGKTLDQLFAPTPLAQTNTLLPAGDEPAAWEGSE